MVTFDSGGAAPFSDSPAPGFFARTLFNTSHKVIGLCYLWLALASVFIGMLLSLFMRIHLVWPSAQIPFLSNLAATPESYAALTLLHGSLMVFLVLTTAPQAGFGNVFLPLQIGAREVAFPLLNLISFWTTALSFLGITVSFFISVSAGFTLWTASVSLFCLAALLTSINFAVSVLDLRARGMTLPRMPLTVWAWFINAILSMLIFSILLGACAFLLSDRLLGSQFFQPLVFLSHQPAAQARTTLLSLWQRLFWFFAQAEVYVAMLPCFGIVSHLLATFSRKPVWAERAAVLALCGVGLFGFCVWGQHMFSSGLNPWSPLVFAVLASSLGIPSFILLLSWIGTLWRARPQLNTAMLFALGFVSLFVSGGISGIFLARSDLASSAANADVVTGHFHLVMGVAAMFAILAALFFWFPKLFGQRLNEPLGKLHFWVTIAGVFCVFMPMHWLGLMTHTPTSGGLAEAVPSTSWLNNLITVATIVTVAAQAIFVFNFVWTLWRSKKVASGNPWRATTLEWAPAAAAAPGFAANEPVVHRGAYEFFSPFHGEDFTPQWVERAPAELAPRTRVSTSPYSNEPQQHLNEQKAK
jgi:cytochrome c oxidase subunit 1